MGEKSTAVQLALRLPSARVVASRDARAAPLSQTVCRNMVPLALTLAPIPAERDLEII